ncbi:TetR/AcrR family transcriptional regulator [uncultured Alteromonas sp.]|jgi:AcrR family transcriptional regulator|uniref:TetR/AcrR family transcriptional regulator n=1 Tax=uncultured Alteromonas sp. TaxID=179113 RepID=UPI0025E333E6|nr:TetR/AcrR family transcriptional regulator [uncultured Alteromonas sp.]
MGYPREQSIQQATEVFWLKGYLGTGMRDLQTAMDKRPGSIYSAFGSKEGLYLEVLNHYTDVLHEQIMAVANSDNTLQQLREFLRSPLTVDDSAAHKIQCLIVKTQADWAELPEGVKNALQTALANLREAFKAVIIKAQSVGELPRELPEERVAMWLQGQFIALRTLATSVALPASLTWMADKIVSDLTGDWAQ